MVYREELSIARANDEEKPWLPHIRPDYSTLRKERAKGCMFQQDAEKARQLRSRIVQILNVPQRVRLRSSLAAVLLNGLFEHPVRAFWTCP